MNKIKSLLALLAALVCGGAWAAQIAAEWKNFTGADSTDGIVVNGYVLKSNGNDIATDGSIITINQSQGIHISVPSNKREATVVVEYSNLSVGTDDTCAIITMGGGNNQPTWYNDQIGVCAVGSDRTVSGVWARARYTTKDSNDDTITTRTIKESGVLAFAYNYDNTTRAYVDGVKVYNADQNLRGSDVYIHNIGVGGKHSTEAASSGTQVTAATNMKISAIRVYDTKLSDTEVAADYMDAGHPFLLNFKLQNGTDAAGWLNYTQEGGASIPVQPSSTAMPRYALTCSGGNIKGSFAAASTDSFSEGHYIDINGQDHANLLEEIAASLGLTDSIPESVYKTGMSHGARATGTATFSGLLPGKKYLVYVGIGVNRSGTTNASGIKVESSGYTSVDALEYVVTRAGTGTSVASEYQTFDEGTNINGAYNGNMIVRMKGVVPKSDGTIVYKHNMGDGSDGQGLVSISFVAVAPYEPKFPEYTATVTENCDFSAITWTPALPTDLSMAKLVLTTTGEPTINVASALSGAELDVIGSVKFANQNNLAVGKLNIPQDSTVTFTTATTFSGSILGEGTLKWDVGVNEDCTSDAKRIASDKFAEFAGTFHVVSGRYKPSASINSAVTIKVTHGGQIWLTNGQTFNNVFELSGRGWGGTGNDVEQTALRFEGVLGATATVKIVDDPDHTPTAIGSTSNTTVQGKFSGSGDLELRGSGALTINEPYHPDFTGKVTSTSDFTLGKNSGLSANSPIKFGSEIVIPANKTFSLNGGNLNGASFANNNKYVVNSKITISNGARLKTLDGAYRFSDVTIPVGATCYATFNWKKGWLFDALNVPATSTLQIEIPNDSDSRTMYVGVDGGTINGTCRIQNSETDACDVWFSPKGEAFANGKIEMTGSKNSYVVLRDNAQVGAISGERAGAIFGDGSAARTLTLKNGTTTAEIKDVADGKNADRPISLIIDGDVTVNSNIDKMSGSILVNDHTVTFAAMGEYAGAMTLKNASKFNVSTPSANRGVINLDGGILMMEAGTEGTVNVAETATLRLLVTEAQLASGYTATGVTLVEGQNIGFGTIVDGVFVETEQEHSGNKLNAGANTWTAHGENNNWDDVGNWSAGKIPTEGESAVIKVSGDTSITLPSSAISLDVVAISGSGALTFSGSTQITCSTLQVETTTTVASSQIVAGQINVLPDVVLNYTVDSALTINGITGGGKVVKTGSATMTVRNLSASGYAIESTTLEVNGGVVDFRTDEVDTPAEEKVGDARFRDATVIIGEHGSISNYGWVKIPDAGHTLTIQTDVDGKSFMTSDGQHLQGEGTLIKTGSGALNVIGHIDVATTVSAGALKLTNDAELAAVSGAGKVIVPNGVTAKSSGVISCAIEGEGILEIAGGAPTGAAVTALQDASKWTGTILVKGNGNDNNFSGAVAALGNAQSILRVSGVRAAALGNITTAVTLEVVDNGDVKGFTQQDGSGGNVYKFGALAGNGTFYSNGFQWYANNGAYLFGDAADFEGTILFANHTKGGFWVVVGDSVPTLPATAGGVIHACVYVKAGYTLGLGGTVNSITDTNYFAGTLKVQSGAAEVQTSAQFVEGSKIDLSKAGSLLTLPATATGTTMVIVGDREITVGDQLIAWESIPEGFTAKLASGSLALEPREDGLYVVNRGPATIVSTDWNFNTFTLNGVSTTMIEGDAVEIPSTLARDDYTEWHATDGTDKLAGHAILANSSMNWKWSIKRMTIGSGVSIYAYGTSGTAISDGTVIDGAGTFSLKGNEVLTVNGSVVISCGVDAAEGNFKLAEDASLTVNAALADGKVTTAVPGKVVGMNKVGSVCTYVLWDETTPPAPIVVPEGTTEVQLVPGQTATYSGEIAPETIKIVVPNVSGSGSFDITQYFNVSASAGSISATLKDDATTKPTVSAMAMPTTQEEGDQVSLTITPIQGLFYSIVTCDTPNGTFTGGDGEQATTGEAKTLSIAMPAAKVQYFKVRVKATK